MDNFAGMFTDLGKNILTGDSGYKNTRAKITELLNDGNTVDADGFGSWGINGNLSSIGEKIEEKKEKTEEEKQKEKKEVIREKVDKIIGYIKFVENTQNMILIGSAELAVFGGAFIIFCIIGFIALVVIYVIFHLIIFTIFAIHIATILFNFYRYHGKYRGIRYVIIAILGPFSWLVF